MKLQFDSEDKRMPWPLIWGFVAMLVWSFVLNTFSITHEFGKAPGLEVGSWVIIWPLSRHLDPYILGVVVAFLIWSFRVSPPTKVRSDEISSANGVYMILGWTMTVFTILAVIKLKLVVHNMSWFGIVMFVLGVSLIFPFDWKLSIGFVVTVSIFLWFLSGLAVVAVYLPLVWLGKWAIWWGVNIIRHRGFDGAYMRLKSQRLEVTISPSPSCSVGTT